MCPVSIISELTGVSSTVQASEVTLTAASLVKLQLERSDNGEMMEIVPVDDHLLIEARLSPRGIEGAVETISPDTIQDKVKPEIVYYRVVIRTHQDYLVNKRGHKFSISPGGWSPASTSKPARKPSWIT